MNLELHATPEGVMHAVEAVQTFGREQGLTEKQVFSLMLALEEAGSNVVNHSLKRDARLKFCVTIEHASNAIVLTLRDRGPEFDPTRVVPRERAEDEQTGGWGIQLVRRYMDEMIYRREGGENILRLIKRLAPAGGEK